MDYLTHITIAYAAIGAFIAFGWPLRQTIQDETKELRRSVEFMHDFLGEARQPKWKIPAFAVLASTAVILAWPVLIVSWYRHHR